ncbi:MAG: hypothetical protein QM660_08775 [Dysgonomonas sp.]
MQISESVYLAFDTILDDEVSVTDVSCHIKTFIPDYEDVDVDVISKRVSSYLSRNTNSKNPLYKREKQGIYKRRKSFRHLQNKNALL